MIPLRFAPYREIAREIGDRLVAARGAADPLAPWPEEVIVPSRGVAEAIAGELVTRMPNGIAALRLHTIEELAASSVPVRVASDLERRLAMRTAIRAVDHPMMESRGIAAMLERAYRDLRDSGVTLAEFASRAKKARGLRNGKRTEAIVRAWSEYERLIAALGATDGADRLARASVSAPQILAGFYDMTGAQLAFVESLLRTGRISAIWIPSEAAFAQAFVRAVTPYAEVVRDPAIEIRKPQAEAMQYDTRLEELQDVCARVAELIANGTPADRIGIVARSLAPYDARLLRRFAEEHGFRTTLDDEIPLSAHRIGRGALTLLRLRERGFPRADVLELVRDGLHTKTRIDPDEADAATRRARIAGGTSAELRTSRTRPPILETYIALVAELEQLPPSVDGSMFRIETDEDLAAAEKLDQIAEVFKRAEIWGKGLDVPSLIDAIEHETLTRQPPTANRQPSVWAGEILRFRGRSFTHLFAVRMQDDVFPQRRTEDPLVPDPDRRLLGVREIGDGRDEESLLFSLLGENASHVHFSFATGDGFGKVLRPSRFLRNVPRSTPAARTTRRQPPTANRQLQLLAMTGTKSPFDGYLGALPKPLAALSPTQLEDFGECPQKFLLKHVLGVTDIDQPERELQINHRDKGTIDHRILEQFHRDGARAEELDAIIDERFDALERDQPPFNRTVRDIERRATKRLLREFVARDLEDLAANGLTPKWFEYRFGSKHREAADHPEPFVVEAGGVPVRVEGTIDRIDAGDGRYRIVDYKSGKAARHHNLGDKIDRGVRLQLALYAMAVAEFFGAEPEQVSGTIKPIVVSELKAEKFAFALHEKKGALLETLEIFIRAIVAGEFPAFPNDNDADFNSCKYCPVNHSCRTRHDQDERYAVTQAKDPRTLLGGGRA
ncbi:MAG TPA: PD-(D/E)XK nuclease family protein [Thermoanaerobaculia bacterium]|nr:PD-(D/E)XK nuclease family protein [Thermoanaerobaculia bacterium]